MLDQSLVSLEQFIHNQTDHPIFLGMKKQTLLILLPFFVVSVIWGLSYPVTKAFIPKPEERGQFGDTFGAANALFSGLAFAAVISTLIWQNNRNRADQAIDRALRLYDEWHSMNMHESRIQVSNLIVGLEKEGLKFPTLSELEQQQLMGGQFANFADHVFRIIHFFERLVLLRDENMLDRTLLNSLMSTYLRWYQIRLVRQLDVSHETNPDFVNLLERIHTLM